jgi:Ca2+-binding RTX toxin-like protein
MPSGRLNKGLVAAGGCLLVALAAAPAALASTVTISGNTIRVAESGNEANRITVSYNAGADLYAVNDSGANLTARGDCASADAHTATCPGAGIRTISVDTGARDDTITLDPGTIPTAVTEDLEGGPANDTLTGSAAGGRIRGGNGRDLLNGGSGPDDIAGGRDFDALFYPNRATPISITIGFGGRNDGGTEDQGAAGRDTVEGDVEAVVGTPLNDVLAGDGSSETLDGLAGDDTLIGNSGGDTLRGFEGNDLLFGGPDRDLLSGWLGRDRLFGGPNRDLVAGGPDRDLVVGNLGRDTLKGKAGIDFLRAKDGVRDLQINCGPGRNGREGATRDRRLDPRALSC